jgi:hypothetical protein
VRPGWSSSPAISAISAISAMRARTQCGFASAGPGKAISEDSQENKLRLVAEVADRVWHA